MRTRGTAWHTHMAVERKRAPPGPHGTLTWQKSGNARHRGHTAHSRGSRVETRVIEARKPAVPDADALSLKWADIRRPVPVQVMLSTQARTGVSRGT